MSFYDRQERSTRNQSSGGLKISLIIVGVFVLLAVTWLAISLRRVDPGKVGVLVDYGKGTATGAPVIKPLSTGQFVLINPATQRLAEYDISQQTLSMLRSDNEGQVAGDDSVSCNDIDGIQINVDSSTLWRVNPEEAGQLYLLRPDAKLSGSEGTDISSTIVRREVRNAITNACGSMKYPDIYGAQRVLFGEKVTEILGVALAKSHLQLDSFLLGEVFLKQEQMDAISRKSVAEQAALEAAFLKEKAENEAAAAVAKAEGDKKVEILRAEAQAKAIQIINEQLQNSPYYIKYVYATKWNGALPTTVVTADGAIPLIDLPAGVLEPTPTP